MDLERVMQAVTSEAALRAQLVRGEQVLWMGRPRLGYLWPKAMTFLRQSLGIAVAICFLTIADSRSSSLLFLVLLILGHSLNALILEPWIDASRRERTVYAVTDRRVLIVRDGFSGHKVQSLPLREIAGITMTGHPDGRGTIYLGNDPKWMPQGVLRFIERPEEVSGLIRQAQLAARFPETLGSSATQVSPAL